MKTKCNVALSLCLGVSSIAIAILAGCEWSGGGGATSTNSRYSFVNFSGTYRGGRGDLLITDYTKTGGNSTNTIYNETIANGNGSRTTFSGVLKKRPLVPGSVTITAPSYVFVDDGLGGLDVVTPQGSSAYGVINYSSGAWSLNFQGAAPESGSAIKATYQIVYSTSLASGSSSASGVTGGAIIALQVEQFGNVLKITDNNGATYNGKFGDIRSTGGVGANSPTGTVSAGDVFIGDFSAEGTSAAGVKIKMVGTFNGAVASISGSNAQLSERTMTGSWIENAGKVGDILGYAEDFLILVPGN